MLVSTSRAWLAATCVGRNLLTGRSWGSICYPGLRARSSVRAAPVCAQHPAAASFSLGRCCARRPSRSRRHAIERHVRTFTPRRCVRPRATSPRRHSTWRPVTSSAAAASSGRTFRRRGKVSPASCVDTDPPAADSGSGTGSGRRPGGGAARVSDGHVHEGQRRRHAPLRWPAAAHAHRARTARQSAGTLSLEGPVRLWKPETAEWVSDKRRVEPWRKRATL